jgi:hypothetical protein
MSSFHAHALPTYLPTYLPVCLSIWLSVHLFLRVYLSVDLLVWQLSTYPPTCFLMQWQIMIILL